MHIFLTGGAGFIGFHAARALLARGHTVTAVDALNDYYDPALKHARLKQLESQRGFCFVRCDIADAESLAEAARGKQFDVILHLAAQAGVRYASENPSAYTHSNLVGHQRMLDFARRQTRAPHFIYASSSSIYGNDTPPPFREDARADKPVSYYGATKRAGELLSHSYAELFGLQQTGLRFFTVYGPWGRPDMAYWSFTEKILCGQAVPVFGNGKLRRDFTYIDDIVDVLVRIVETPFQGDENSAPHGLYNLGNNRPEDVLTLARLIEEATGRKALLEQRDAPPGDMRETYADISRAARDFGFAPKTALADGIPQFVEWYRKKI